MIEIYELFMTAPMELRVILLTGAVIGIYSMFDSQDNKDKY